MDLTPVKLPGLQPMWTLAIHAAHALDLGRKCLLQGRLHKVRTFQCFQAFVLTRIYIFKDMATFVQISGHFSKAWEERYCCLMPGALLLYFDSPDDPNPKGVIPLSRDSVIERSGEHLGQKHVLTIKPNPTDPAARIIHLAADSEDEAREWTETMFKCSVAAAVVEQNERAAHEVSAKLVSRTLRCDPFWGYCQL
jgi:hypothetical protein